MLSLEVDHFGFIFSDSVVLDAVEANAPLIDYDPECLSVHGINVLAERIDKHWNGTIEDSDKKLLLHTQNMYHELQVQSLAGGAGSF